MGFLQDYVSWAPPLSYIAQEEFIISFFFISVREKIISIALLLFTNVSKEAIVLY